ncbi:HSF-type DNA-binding-domain-containing protein, partial [Blyttiomyces helicus]
LLEDESVADSIRWTPSGDTFVVKDANNFARFVLPKYFKHNNFSSFVRQLNKYDFHKVKGTEHGRVYGDQAWEFHHPNFQLQHRSLLDGIKRKASIAKARRSSAPNPAAQVASLERFQSIMADYAKEMAANYIAIVDSIAAVRRAVMAQEQVTGHGWSQPPRVLIVEDDVVSRRISTKILQGTGCSFDVAVDGVEAVERMSCGNKYDVVLMNIILPNLDGIAATTKIREFDQSTPIISVTSNATPTDRISYLAKGITDMLPKPFDKQSLVGMIGR